MCSEPSKRRGSKGKKLPLVFDRLSESVARRLNFSVFKACKSCRRPLTDVLVRPAGAPICQVEMV